MESLIDSLKSEWQNLVRLTPRVVLALLLLALLVVIGRLVGGIVGRLLEKGRPGVSIPVVRSGSMEACRRSLKQNGFTISSDVTTSVLIDATPKARLRVIPETEDDRSPG